MVTFSEEYRRQIVARYVAGESTSRLYKETGHSPSSILVWVREFGETVRPTKQRSKIRIPKAFRDPLSGVTVKPCSDCGQVKLLDQFTRDVNNIDGVRDECKECRNRVRREKYPEVAERKSAEQRQKRKDDPESFRYYDIKKRFRLSREEYDSLFESQGKRCAACETSGEGESSGFWHVDHDHACCSNRSGRTCGKCVRGILCKNCNLALGNAKDDPIRLRKLADYIEKLKLNS